MTPVENLFADYRPVMVLHYELISYVLRSGSLLFPWSRERDDVYLSVEVPIDVHYCLFQLIRKQKGFPPHFH